MHTQTGWRVTIEPLQSLGATLPVDATTVGPIARQDVQIVIIAASLGGPQALSRLLADLPASFPLPIAIVQHQHEVASTALLTGVLRKRTGLRTHLARQGDALEAGGVYVAPPSQHMTVSPQRTVVLLEGLRIHGLKSAADPLFSSVAAVYRSAVVAVVLTGTDGDGAAGARAVREGGGIVIVQDPDDARAAGMPVATLAAGGADWVLPLDAIAPKLRTLAGMA